jgi:hypothetical protein
VSGRVAARVVAFLALVHVACTESGATDSQGSGGSAGAGTTTGGASGSTSAGGASGMTATGGASGSTSAGGASGTTATGGTAGVLPPPDAGEGGGPAVADGTCGLVSAAFCDTFEDGPHAGGRSGELDAARWSVLRAVPTTHAELGGGYEIGPAFLPECRPGVSNTYAVPDDDTRICEPTATIASRHLLAAVAAQNYGLNTYRIRQPFDFDGRVGTISLDVDLTNGGLYGWPAVAISEDPSPAPSYDFPERGSGARNGVQIDFVLGWCNTPQTVMPLFYSSRDHVDTAHEFSYECDQAHATTAPGALNHVEIRVSTSGIEVWASDASPDGVTFPNFQRIGALALELPFSRGYVSLIARNHATLKYWSGASWATRWDNVGFDGPVITGRREHSAPEPLGVTTGVSGCEVNGACIFRGKVIQDELIADGADCVDCEAEGEGRTVGWVVPTEDETPVSIEIPEVSLAGMQAARLVLAADYPWFEWNDVFPPPTALALRYRLNGGAWHDRPISELEANAFAGDQLGAGLLNQIIELEPAELVEGTNVLELGSVGTWTGAYRVAVVGLDLVLDVSP